MRETYDINANEVLTLLNEAKQRSAAVSIEGKIGSSNIKKDNAQFAIGVISSRHSRIDRNNVTGVHEVVDDSEREFHEITLHSQIPPYELEIKYSLRSSDADYHGGMFGIVGVLWDVGKTLLRIGD